VKIPLGRRLRAWLTPAIILLMAAAIVILITGNWNRWASERISQKTDDAYLRADLTPLSTKVAGLVEAVAVSDYQAVRAGDLLVQLRDDDFRAQVQQAEAAVLQLETRLSRISARGNYRTHGSFRRKRGSTQQRRRSRQHRPESTRRNRQSAMRRAASTQRRRTRSARNWNGGGRKRLSRPSLQRIRHWSRWWQMTSVIARRSRAARMT